MLQSPYVYRCFIAIRRAYVHMYVCPMLVSRVTRTPTCFALPRPHTRAVWPQFAGVFSSDVPCVVNIGRRLELALIAANSVSEDGDDDPVRFKSPQYDILMVALEPLRLYPSVRAFNFTVEFKADARFGKRNSLEAFLRSILDNRQPRPVAGIRWFMELPPNATQVEAAAAEERRLQAEAAARAELLGPDSEVPAVKPVIARGSELYGVWTNLGFTRFDILKMAGLTNIGSNMSAYQVS